MRPRLKRADPKNSVSELRRILGRKTTEVEILKAALDLARTKPTMPLHSPLSCTDDVFSLSAPDVLRLRKSGASVVHSDCPAIDSEL